MTAVASGEIPNRSLFRAAEVCEIVAVQPYVLRSWEAEFPDLGVAREAGAPRVYRRADVERVLRIKQLVFGDGLTLAGARRRLSEEGTLGAAGDPGDLEMAALLDADARERVLDVRRGLEWMLTVLSREVGAPVPEFELRAQPAAAGRLRPPHKAPARSAPSNRRRRSPVGGRKR